jgi:hypothetical protein
MQRLDLIAGSSTPSSSATKAYEDDLRIWAQRFQRRSARSVLQWHRNESRQKHRKHKPFS